MNEEQFIELIERYQSPLHSLIYKMVHSWETARDLAQDTFIKLWHFRYRIITDTPSFTLIYKIAVNLSIDHLRKKKPDRLEFIEEVPQNSSDNHDLSTAYIQKEIGGEERISISQHLKACKSCRESYLKELKLYYRLEYEEVMSPPEPVQAGFKNDILARTRYENTGQQKFKKKWLWYTAAAILIAGILIGKYLAPLPTGSDKHPDEENTSISSLLETEDWGQLQKVLQNRVSLRRHAQEEININVLLEKLKKLQNSIHPSPTIDISTGFSSSAQDSSISTVKIQISIEDFVTLLKQIQSQKKQIMLKEVSSILTDI